MTEQVYESFDPLLLAEQAENMVRLCERFGRYGMYSEEGLNQGIGEDLPQRYDAAMNFVRTGGRLGQVEEQDVLVARTNYFRETYAYGEHVGTPGIEPFLHYEGFTKAAQQIHGRPLIEPAIVYANLLVPGQQLATHTDVPEFRGANRRIHPEWLLVVMHHSELFDEWRIPIATAVSWFHNCKGGEFHFYPNGAQAPPQVHPVRFNTALILDTDSTFHGIDRVAERGPIAPLRPGMQLTFEGDRSWAVRSNGSVIARYRWEDLRFSISWKAYCFADEDERQSWQTHSDDLSVDFVLERLIDDLRARGRLRGERPGDHELALMLIDEYIHFPPPAAA